ncbi:nacht and ankyrin domain protein [Colletotrichum chrysophilum]|uniref:Nacht and ankyrin domain protein n=1 Tax=Colletotrichum chrysophilum TaxID=1836956 RepID=A0AAD9AWW2_9PEZI|nr:nacht and ankyrin domain protein [Colletotrichum chrysophilum]
MSFPILDKNSYTIGWICALSVESAAAQAFLDEQHDVPREISDNNSYVTGRIGRHNVVIAVMPQKEYGTTTAATTAKDMIRSFPQIRLGVMVGIGGGAPSQEHDIRLGDVVVSSRGKGSGGVIQFDYGKSIQGEDFQETGHLNQPPTSLLTAAAALDARYDFEGPRLNDKVNEALKGRRKAFRNKYSRPLDDTDRLHRPEVTHPDNLPGDCVATCSIKPKDLVERYPRSEDDDNPSVHYGLIASSNQVMKDAMKRDKLVQRGVLCFEMEAAGLMNDFPCLVVRGICDYADTHKNSSWQPYAAMVAAAYTKDLLALVNPTSVEGEKKLSDLITSAKPNIETVASTQKEQSKILHAMDSHQRAHNLKEWLCPAESSDNAERARDQRYEGTGTWLLESDPFQEWLAGGCQHLCLYGPGGCGKTVLSSTILDSLKESHNGVILYFFFDFSDSQKRTVGGLIRTLLFQLCSLEEPARILDILRGNHDDGKIPPNTRDLLNHFQDFLGRVKSPVILMDALDECNEEDQEQEKLIKWLINLGSASSLKHVKIITTARPEAAFLTGLSPNLSTGKRVHLDKEAIKIDIQSYIKGCLRDRPGFHTYAPDHPIVSMIPEKLIEKADGMFRYAACQIDDIVSCLGPEEIEEVLDSLPQTIQETYRRSIERIPRRYHDKAIRLLQFLVNLDKPLDLMAAVDIVAVRSDFRKFAPTDRIRPADIVRLCPNLLSITEGKRYHHADPPTKSQLHLAHLSVKEYLLHYDCPTFTFIGGSASVNIVRTCLSYLLHSHPTGGFDNEKDHDQQASFPFASYAESVWVGQAAAAEISPEAVSALAVYLEMGSWRRHPWHMRKRLENMFQLGDLETGNLHFAAGLDLRETAKLLILRGADVGDKEESCMTLLEIASYMDQVEIVQLLLGAGVSPNTKGNTAHGSAFRISCMRGNLRIAKLLAMNGADLCRLEGDKRLEKGPLQIAVMRRDIKLFEVLIDAGVDIDADCGYFGTALHTACILGFDDVVAWLLQHGANLNAKGGPFEHALQAAAQKGHTNTVKLLLDEGSDANAQGGRYGNALCAAVISGHKCSIELLINNGADVNSQGGRYGNALTNACMREFPEITRYLLEQGADVTATIPGFWKTLQVFVGRRSLHWTVQKTDILESLLGAGAELHPHGSPSALKLAVDRGHLEPTRILLSRGADPNILFDASFPLFDHSLLIESLVKSQPEIAQELLRYGADPNAKTSHRLPNQTVLHLAIDKDFPEVVCLLLEKGADPEKLSGFPPFTPLQISLKKGSIRCVRQCLEHGADVEALGGYSQNLTAVEMARRVGNEVILQLLEKAGTEKRSGKRRRRETDYSVAGSLLKRRALGGSSLGDS